jgi:diacylglycerol kinase family enzyme
MAASKDRFLAIVNPAAGGGKSAKLAGPALSRLREKGLKIDVIASTGQGHAVQLAREAHKQGYRKFLAVGGDGTAHEILNGIFAGNPNAERVALGFLPLGTATVSSRLTSEGVERPAPRKSHPSCRSHSPTMLGAKFSFNILSLGFTADVGAFTNRVFKGSPSGYSSPVRVIQLKRRAFVLRCDDETEWDERRSLFLTFNNSKYTGGSMLIAPNADPSDGFIEYVRWGPIGRLGLLRNLPKLYDGSHLKHPLASRKSVKHVEFKIQVPVDVMIDGEIFSLECKALDIFSSAVDVFI